MKSYSQALLLCAQALLLVPASSAGEDAAIMPAPVLEITFNTVDDAALKLEAGGKIGTPSTGVSGKSDDRCYMGVISNSDNIPNGPRALSLNPLADKPEDEFTTVFWYCLDDYGPELQVPLNTYSAQYLLTASGFELRLQQLPAAPWGTNFYIRQRGPYAGWRDTNRWIFVAFSWSRENNSLAVFQGTPDEKVAYVRSYQGATPAQPTHPRDDREKVREVIGNNFRTDRPLAGRMDNLRQFNRALNAAQLEAIRKADLQNQPVSGR